MYPESNSVKSKKLSNLLFELSKKNCFVSYPILREHFMRELGLISRYAFDNWVLFCISKRYLKVADGSVRQTGNRVFYQILIENLVLINVVSRERHRY